MAIQHKQSYAVSKSSSVAGSAFEVEADAKLFATLTASLYTDKPVAVPREMICNMKDAHIERNEFYQASTLNVYNQSVYASIARGAYLKSHEERLKWLAPKDKMYELQVPSVIDPTLIFTDYGIGLNIDQIMGPVQTTFCQETNKPIILRDENGHPVRRGGLYKTIFKSTKESTNNTTGAYGLGSKSPYALCDTFTVESRYNGEKHMYIMYMTDDRQPMVNWVTKDEFGEPAPIPTDEYNGLTVSMVIQESDIERVQKGCAKVLRAFEPEWQPILSGQPIDVKMFDRKTCMGNMYVQSVEEVEEENRGAVHYAVQGSVAYPINTSYLSYSNRQILNSLGADTYTEFAIGQLNVPPSRENLDYINWTVDNLNRHIAHSLEFFTARVHSDIRQSYEEAQKGNILGRYKVVKELQTRWGKTLFEAALKQMSDERYKGFASIKGDSAFPRPTVTIQKEVNKVQDDGSTKKETVSFSEKTLNTTFFVTSSKGVKRDSSSGLSLNRVNSGEYQVLAVDGPVKAINRMMTWLVDDGQLSSSKPIMLVNKTFCIDQDPDYKGDLKAYIRKWLGDNDVELIMTTEVKMPKITFSPSASSGMSRFTGGTSHSPDSWAKLTPKDLRDKIFNDLNEDGEEDTRKWIYVDMSRFDITTPNVSQARLDRLRDLLSLSGYNTPKNPKYRGILAIRPSAQKIREQNHHLLISYAEVMEELQNEVAVCNSGIRKYLRAHYFARKCSSEKLSWMYRLGKLLGDDVKWMERYQIGPKPRCSYYSDRGHMVAGANDYNGISQDLAFHLKNKEKLSKRFLEDTGMNLNEIVDTISSNSSILVQLFPSVENTVKYYKKYMKRIRDTFPITWELMCDNNSRDERLFYMAELELFTLQQGFKRGQIYTNMEKVSDERDIDKKHFSKLNKIIEEHNPIYAVKTESEEVQKSA